MNEVKKGTPPLRQSPQLTTHPILKPLHPSRSGYGRYAGFFYALGFWFVRVSLIFTKAKGKGGAGGQVAQAGTKQL